MNKFCRPSQVPKYGINSPKLKRDLLKLQAKFKSVWVLETYDIKFLIRIGKITKDVVIEGNFLVLWPDRSPCYCEMFISTSASFSISEKEWVLNPKNLIDGKRWIRSEVN